jgi:hypothetical protein
MSLQPRQQYGLGSFVKKAVKGVTGAVKGVAKGVKKFAKSDLGKAAILAAIGFGIPGTSLGGLFGRASLGGAATGLLGQQGIGATLGSLTGSLQGSGVVSNFIGKNKGMLATSLLGGVLGSLSQQEQEDLSVNRNVGALETKLRQAYENQKLFENDPQGLEKQIASDLSEYTSGQGAYAAGGRVGYAFGTDNPETNAIQAAGIESLPLNQNPAGVTELDLRETGGFIPPVGVKEKADDIPAMLANNEFVMTADAVRQFGDGDVNKGAKRMYAMMKTLENGGRV